MRTHLPRLRQLCVILCLALLVDAHAKPADWTDAINALTQADSAQSPPIHGIVFVGSSPLRIWETLAQDFPNLPGIRRGFGGSALADSVYYLDRIVLPYQPKTVVLYAGENDLSAGKSPEMVAADFAAFCERIHAALPHTRIIFIAVKPSPLRWALHEKMERTNALVVAACAKDPRLTFVDVYSAMLGADGLPQPELFSDGSI